MLPNDFGTAYGYNPTLGSMPTGTPSGGANPYGNRQADAEAVKHWWRTYIGQEVDPENLQRQLANPNFGNVQQAIYNSPEAQEFRRRSAAAPTAAPAAAAPQASAAAQQQQSGTTTTTTASTTPPPSNPQLDALLQQMIANQKMYAENAASRNASQKAFADTTRANILDRFNKASAPVDENDPYIARQRQVHSAESQRAFNAGREAMAARAFGSGTPQGASDAYLQSSAENLAKDNAGYTANLMADEYNKRRDEISKMLSLGSGVLTADENRMLEEEMGTIDAELKNLGQKGSFNFQQQGLDLEGRRIGNQNQQFYDRMGYDVGLQEALMNQQIMQSLMGS